MESHFTGPIIGTRQGSVAVKHTIPVTFADTSAAAKLLLSIDGSAAKPVWYRVITAAIRVANNAATTATLSVGITGAGYTDIINAQDLKAVAGTNMTIASAVWKLATARVDIYALSTFVGTPTAGAADVMIEAVEANITEPTAQGS